MTLSKPHTYVLHRSIVLDLICRKSSIKGGGGGGGVDGVLFIPGLIIGGLIREGGLVETRGLFLILTVFVLK